MQVDETNSNSIQTPSLKGKAGMGLFAALVTQISSSTKTNDKPGALADILFVLAEDKTRFG